MLQRVKKLVQNHWKKAVVGGIAVQATVYAVRYAAEKFKTYQETQALEYWQKIKKQQHFENVDQNCVTTFRQLYQRMKNKIQEVLDAEMIQEQIKLQQVTNKLEAWQELKIIAFTRVLANVYGSAILYVFLRIQLSILGACMINDSKSKTQRQHSLEEEGPQYHPYPRQSRRVNSGEDNVEKKFLDLSKSFVNEDIVKLCDYLRQLVTSEVGSISLKQNMSATDVENLLWSIVRSSDVSLARNGFNGVKVDNRHDTSQQPNKENPMTYPWKYIFPDALLENYQFFRGEAVAVGVEAIEEEQPTSSQQLQYRNLVCEAFDLLDCDDTKDILRYLERQGISHLMDRVSELIRQSSSDSLLNEETGLLVDPKLPMAKIIPILTSLALVDIFDDPWVHFLTTADTVRVFSANIYEAFCDE